jgi:hypothetical protein
LKPHRLRVFDSRFGIRLPYQGTLFDDLEELRLTPPTLGSCEISVRGPGFGQAARFDGEMFIGPPMAEPHGAELLVRASDFIIRLTPPALKFESVGSIDDMEHTVEEWAELLRALTLMATGRATLILDAARDGADGYKVDVSRGQRIGRVSSEWFSRPADER